MHRKQIDIKQTGFGLVEIMVGLAIGLLATLVIMQIFSSFEAQKRATTGSADAQASGSIALFTIERDMQMAGYGLLPITSSPLECDPSPTTAAGVDLSPVVITDGGNAAGASDTISIRYGTTTMAGTPSAITANPVASPTGAYPQQIIATVDTNMGCQTGDIALIINGTTCVIRTVTALSTAPDYSGVKLNDGTGIMVGSNLACLGAWNQISYRVNNGNLEVNGVPRMAGVVNLQAQYGISATTNSNQVTQWVDATGGTWASPTVTNRNRIKAIRVAVVARNGQYEKDVVSAACSSTTDPAPTGICSWEGSTASPAPVINLNTDADWTKYRYRVFQTIIPLRNVIWARETL
ncbi:MAG: PilW family protein [Betaproteobacteria bacterium]